LFPLPDDATLLVDLGNGRMSLFDGAQKYRESAPLAQGTPGGPGGFSLIIPRGVDGRGRIYYQPPGAGGRTDSAPVIRWDRAASKFDTVARVKLPALVTRSSGGPNDRRVSQRPAPYPAQEAWAVGNDGRLAIVRVPSYRVDLVTPGAAPVAGPVLAATPVPIRDAEKREYLAESAANGLSVSVSNENGNVSMSFRRGRGRDGQGDEPDISGQEWPAHKPTVTGTVVVDPAGRVWVEKSVPAGAARRFDVIGSNGAIVSRVVLPKDRRLIAVGTKGLYLRHTDPDGLNYLERYDQP